MVIAPPSKEPNAMGMSSLDGLLPLVRASWSATGIIMAMVPVLLINAEQTVVTEVSAII